MPRGARASVLILLLSSLASNTSAQQQGPPPTETEASYRRARAVLDAAAKALAGDRTLPGMDAVSFQINGKLYHRNQSLRAEGPPDATPYRGELTVDFARNRMVFERTSAYPGGFDFSNRWVRAGDDTYNYDLLRKQRYTVPPRNLPGFFESVVLRRLPQFHVKAAQERADTLRWMGEAEWNGAKHNVISYANASNDVLSLFIDAQTHLISKFEFLLSDPLFGDVVHETAFTGYTVVGGIPLPTGQVDKRGGVLTLEVSFSGHGLTAPESAFAALAGFTPAQQAPPGQPAVQELAKDVYLIEGLAGGGYRMLFVAFRDFVVAIEAPVNDQTASQAIRLIKQTVPDKPIRFVVPTHHHDDHSGGIRAFVAEGATILTTPGNANYFVSVVYRALFTIQPDALARTGRRFTSSSQFLDAAIDGKAVIENGGKRIEIIDIGPGPHAQEMLVAWLPEEKILFQGDLLNRPTDGTLRPANDTTAHFYDWLQKSDLPVEKLLGVHSQVSSMADLEATMELRRQRAAR